MENQPQQPLYDTAKMAEMSRLTDLMNITRRMKIGAGTFYWIAGLSVINSLVSIFGGGLVFVIGLGATMFIDAFTSAVASEMAGSSIVLGMGFLFSLVFDIIFVLFGYFAGKGHRWAFFVGMVLYGLDAVLMLFFKEWIGFAFHLYFLWSIWQGFQALGKLKALQVANPMAIPPAESMR
jgi:hypothetical protein